MRYNTKLVLFQSHFLDKTGWIGRKGRGQEGQSKEMERKEEGEISRPRGKGRRAEEGKKVCMCVLYVYVCIN